VSGEALEGRAQEVLRACSSDDRSELYCQEVILQLDFVQFEILIALGMMVSHLYWKQPTKKKKERPANDFLDSMPPPVQINAAITFYVLQLFISAFVWCLLLRHCLG
jgi:hypothetical protein